MQAHERMRQATVLLLLLLLLRLLLLLLPRCVSRSVSHTSGGVALSMRRLRAIQDPSQRPEGLPERRDELAVDMISGLLAVLGCIKADAPRPTRANDVCGAATRRATRAHACGG